NPLLSDLGIHPARRYGTIPRQAVFQTAQGRPGVMQESSRKKIYDVHSLFYDATFGRLVRRRIARAIGHMNIQPNDKVLDLGIGTGVSLNYYPNYGRIYGIDLSTGMLRQARKKIAERGMENAKVFQ